MGIISPYINSLFLPARTKPVTGRRRPRNPAQRKVQQIDKQIAASACRTLIKPVVSFLLRCGLTWRDFAGIAKKAFVDVATQEYGIDGRPTNVSRVAILTGIGRKDVGKLRTDPANQVRRQSDKNTGATAVLSGWHQDPDFLTRSGKPRVLSTDEGRHSFMTLCERYAGDIPAGAMLKELARVGAVEQNGARLRVISRYYMPSHGDQQWILNAASIFEDLGENVRHNQINDANTPSRFLGRATNTHIPEHQLEAFRTFLEDNGEEFLERVDNWLTTHAVEKSSETRQVRLGIGLFAIQGNGNKEQV